ncbi:PKD domain-containing protein [Blastococcus fimeti]|nr:PKD domain-containing protein [Blastococcus fimeti]
MQRRVERGGPRRGQGRRALSALVAGALAGALIALGLAVPSSASAVEPTPAPLPDTVSADALPTVQTNGVVWSMATVGTTVYATGSFTTATPSGGGAGAARGNLLAFDVRTGALIPGFDHRLNGQGRIVVASPDGSRIYVGGDFTTVDGIARGHVAAFDVATGALVPGFAPTTNQAVYSLAVAGSTVYAGGNFTTAGGQTRTRLAAFNASTGALTSWAPTANNTVRGIVVDPTGTRIVLAGQFGTVNGITAYSIASVDTAGGDAKSQPWGINNTGDPAGAWSLKLYGGVAYASVYAYQIGNVEGVVAFDPTTLDLVWMNDCHGDPYDTWSDGTVLYNASHAHDCETAGSFPDPNPRTWQRAVAMTVAATGILKATTDLPRYTSWEGRPSPSILHFWPTLNTGTYTQQFQGPWSVTGAGDYVVFGGEFTSVNGRSQSGLVRFARPSVAPNDRGPELTAAQMRPQATSNTAGEVVVRFPSSYDMDDAALTYQVFRDGGTTPVHTATVESAWWKRPVQQFTDTTAPAGSTATYRVTVTDPYGNAITSSPSNAVQVATTTSAYARGVLADGPAHYWRVGEPTGTTSYDQVGTTSLTTGAGVGRGAAGAVPGNTAVTTDGTAAGLASTAVAVTTPGNAFSVEAWVRTTSTTGGVIAQYGRDLPAADVATTDRLLYVDAGGRVSFGLSSRAATAPRATTYKAVRSPQPVTDGQWHHLVATVGAAGTQLYVDGAPVASDPTMTRANTRVASGYWMFGGGTVASGVPEAPAGAALAGALDELAVYPATLTAEQVAAHFALATSPAPNTPPTAAFTQTATDLTVAVDATASTDADGTVAGYAWNWGDAGPAGTGATATHAYGTAGTYTVTLTVTDDDGATATTTREVTVTAPPVVVPPDASVLAADSFGRTVSGGLGTADTGGPWTTVVGAPRLSVTPGVAELALPAAGNNTGAYLGGVAQTSADLRTSFRLSAMPTGAAGTYVYVSGRRVAADKEYRVRVRVAADGQVWLALSRVSGTESWPGGEVVVPGLTYAPGATLNVRVQVTGAGTTDIRATVWADGTAEPAAPQLTRTDTTAALQAPGGVGLAAYRPTSNTAASAVRFTSFRVTPVGPAAPVNQAPVAAFTATPAGLGITVDGTGSIDADGTVASYAWDFGDGRTATGPTAAHTYAAAGEYTVTLLVTDDDGATATTTRPVTVTAPVEEPPVEEPPAEQFLAADEFDRSVTGGLGTADVGGAWTVSAGAARQSVSGGAAVLASVKGTNTGSFLGGVSQLRTEVQTRVSLGSVPTGGGSSVYVIGRRVAANQEYRARVRVLVDGSVRVALVRLAGTSDDVLIGAEVLVPGLTYTAGTELDVRVRVAGTGTTELAATVWKAGTPEPTAPTLTRTDTTAALQAPGSVGLFTYLSGSATAPVEVRVATFLVRALA